MTVSGISNVANINSNGIVTITNTTQATGTGTGALIVDGGASVTKDLYVGGNLYVPNIISTSSTTLNVSDPLLYLSASTPYPYGYEIGFYSHFATTGNPPGNGYQHTGLVRNHADNDWYLFSNAAEPEGGTVDLANANLVFDTLKLGGIIASGNANIAGNANVGTSLQVGSGTGGTISGANLVSANYFTGVLTTGAQPNITSTGTLSSLTVSGTTNLGSIGNVTITGGTSGQFITTNGSGVLSFQNQSQLTATVDNFTGDGSTATFTLSVTPTNANYTLVSVQGVAQPRTAYSVSGSSLTFSSAPYDTAVIEVTTLGGSVMSSGITVVSAPAHNNSTGSVGQIAYDSSHLYVCVSTNTWVRTAIDTTW